MTPSDIRFACECTASEGWQGETRDLFEAFLGYDAKGCFIGEHITSPVGICVATRYLRNGVIGEFVVTKAMRGQGFGKRLFEHSIEYLIACGIENIYLEADSDVVALYEKMGFRKLCRSLRFVGTIAGRKNDQVRPAYPSDAERICRIDRELFGDDRSYFVKRRLASYPHLNFVMVDEDRITAYLMAQPGIGVVSVGPWGVTDPSVRPELLLEALSLETGGVPLRIGVLETSTEAATMIRSLETFDEHTPCWRMVRGLSEDLGSSSRLYAIGAAAKG